MDSLNSILSDEEPPKKEPEAAPPAALEAPPLEKPASRRSEWLEKEQSAQGLVRDPETGQFAKKVAPEPEKKPEVKAEVLEKAPEKPAPPVQEMSDKEKAFLRAAEEERKKRQALEARLRDMEAKLPKEPEKTFWDDPEAAFKKQQQEAQQIALNTRLQTAEIIARSRYPDFDEKIAVFGKIMSETPGLHAQWLQSPDPAEFAYKLGKNHQELQTAGDLESLKAKIRKETEAEVRTKIEAELKAKAEALQKERDALPGSLSEARSVGGPNRPVWNGPTSLNDILGSK